MCRPVSVCSLQYRFFLNILSVCGGGGGKNMSHISFPLEEYVVASLPVWHQSNHLSKTFISPFTAKPLTQSAHFAYQHKARSASFMKQQKNQLFIFAIKVNIIAQVMSRKILLESHSSPGQQHDSFVIIYGLFMACKTLQSIDGAIARYHKFRW